MKNNIIDSDYKGFLEQLCRYYMEFLETDFKKRRSPSRKITYRSKGILTSISLLKYDKLRKSLNNIVLGNFQQTKVSNITKGKFVIKFSENFLEKINDNIEKINFEKFELQEVITIVDKYLEKTIIDREAILEELKFEIENIIAENEGKIHKEDIVDLLLDFTCYDFYDELYEIWKNKTILEGEELYAYFYDISFNNNKYPIFFIPITLTRRRDADRKNNRSVSDMFDIEFGSQLLINKSAIEFIARSINDLTGERRGPIDIPNRHLYLGDFDIPDKIQETLNELCSYFKLDLLDINSSDTSKIKNEYTEISNNYYLAICDKSDESLLNDFEELKDLLIKGGSSTLVDIFSKLSNNFLLENPETFDVKIEDEYSKQELTEKLSYHSPIPLNQEQQKIAMALRNPNVKNIIVEGPPGTGKSHTITAIIFNALLEDKSVLMTSDKKEALDVVEDKISGTLDKIKNKDDFLQNPLLRLGKKETNYSKIFKQQNYEKIKNRYFASKRNFTQLLKEIDGCTKTIQENIRNQIDVYSSVDMATIKEIVYGEKTIQDKWQNVIELSEAYLNKEFIDFIKQLCTIITTFREQQNVFCATEHKIDYTKLLTYNTNKEHALNIVKELILMTDGLTKAPKDIIKHQKRDLKKIQKIQFRFPSSLCNKLIKAHEDFENTVSMHNDFIESIYIDSKDFKNNIGNFDDTQATIKFLSAKLKTVIQYYKENFQRKNKKLLLVQSITDNNIEDVDNYVKRILELKSRFFGIIIKRKDLKRENYTFANKFPSLEIEYPNKIIDHLAVEYRFYKLILDVKSAFKDNRKLNIDSLGWNNIERLIFQFKDLDFDKISDQIDQSIHSVIENLAMLKKDPYFKGLQLDLPLQTMEDYKKLKILGEYIDLVSKGIIHNIGILKESGVTVVDDDIDIMWFLEKENINKFYECSYNLKNLIEFLIAKNALIEKIENFYITYPHTFEKIGIDVENLNTLVNNKISDLSADDIECLCEYFKKYYSVIDNFSKLKISNFPQERFSLENTLVLKMTHILDEAVVQFRSENQKDQQEIRDLIRKKKKIPKTLLKKLIDAFPCLLVNIRDLGEYLPLEPEIFDIVIIDEASQVNIAQAFPAILRGKKVIVFGDHKQYSNVKSVTAHIETNNFLFNHVKDAYSKYINNFPEEKRQVLANSIENFNIKKSILEFLRRMANYQCSLRKHFRGYTEIIGYSNKHFYNDYLQVVKIRSKPIDAVLNFHILKDVDKEDIYSNTNSYECEYIIRKLEEMKEKGVKQSVGIITPFRNQQRYIYGQILSHRDSEYFMQDLKLKVMTFDTCQGDEKDIIYYSFVEREGEDILRYIFPKDLRKLDDDDEGTIKAQRLNVGFSRAREEMHFILSKDMHNISSEGGRALMHYLKELKDAKRLPSLDKCNDMEKLVLSYITQTKFYKLNKDNIEIFAQFELGKYLKQIYDIEIPNYRTDFLVVCKEDNGNEIRNIIIEYDGFEFHFKERDNIDVINFDKFYIEQDLERQKTLESYGYNFIRLNKFLLRNDPIMYLDKCFAAICKKKLENSGVVSKVIEDAEKIKTKDIKKCPQCGIYKDKKAFKNPNTLTGTSRYCKECGSKDKSTVITTRDRRIYESTYFLKDEKISQKKCTKCELIKDIRDFRFRKTRGYYESICKECEKREKRKSKSEDVIDQALKILKPRTTPKKDIVENAVNANRTIEISYRNSYGNESRRRIKPISISGDFLKAYCYLRGENRTFRISRIKKFY